MYKENSEGVYLIGRALGNLQDHHILFHKWHHITGYISPHNTSTIKVLIWQVLHYGWSLSLLHISFYFAVCRINSANQTPCQWFCKRLPLGLCRCKALNLATAAHRLRDIIWLPFSWWQKLAKLRLSPLGLFCYVVKMLIVLTFSTSPTWPVSYGCSIRDYRFTSQIKQQKQKENSVCHRYNNPMARKINIFEKFC